MEKDVADRLIALEEQIVRLEVFVQELDRLLVRVDGHLHKHSVAIELYDLKCEALIDCLSEALGHVGKDAKLLRERLGPHTLKALNKRAKKRARGN